MTSTCDNGVCVEAPRSGAFPCDDGDPNTVNDACHLGKCAGEDLCQDVVCAPLDACHVAGRCTAGQCSHPQATDGIACNDDRDETPSDKCLAGTCVGFLDNGVAPTSFWERSPDMRCADLGQRVVPDVPLAECQALCESTPDCIAITFLGGLGPRPCYVTAGAGSDCLRDTLVPFVDFDVYRRPGFDGSPPTVASTTFPSTTTSRLSTASVPSTAATTTTTTTMERTSATVAGPPPSWLRLERQFCQQFGKRVPQFVTAEECQQLCIEAGCSAITIVRSQTASPCYFLTAGEETDCASPVARGTREYYHSLLARPSCIPATVRSRHGSPAAPDCSGAPYPCLIPHCVDCDKCCNLSCVDPSYDVYIKPDLCKDVVCPAAQSCHSEPQCADGRCISSVLQDGHLCDDGRVATENDRCQAGECIGTCAAGYFRSGPTGTLPVPCTKLGACSPQQYEALAPTPTSNRQCRPLSVCAFTEYEQAAPSPTSDRVCRPMTVCSMEQYEEVAATASADRVCRDLSVCDPETEYQARRPGRSRDRLCLELSICADTEYELVAPQAQADRVCLPTTICRPDQEQLAAPTPTSDRRCRNRCSAQEFAKVASGSGQVECVPLQKCQYPSQYESVAPSPTSDRICNSVTLCVLGETYEILPPSAIRDRSCAPVQRCGLDQFQEQEPTLFSDRTCVSTTRCSPSQFELTPPSETTDRVCVAVARCHDNGQFERTPPTRTSDAVCADITVCMPGEYELVAHTATSDRRCAAVSPACVSGSFELREPTTTSDRVCLPWTPCAPTEFEAAAPSTSADRVCLATKVCHPLLEYEQTAPSLTSDRGCQRLTQCSLGETFESVPPTQTSDRRCSAVSLCQDGQAVLLPPTLTTDIVCDSPACAPETFESSAPTTSSARVCTQATQCTGLEHEAVPLSASADRVCQPLEDCAPFWEYEPATQRAPRTDRVCVAATACDFTREYTAVAWGPFADRECKPFTLCGPGEFQAAPPSVTSDRVCQPLTGCPAGEFLAGGTPTRDGSCTPLTVCSARQYEIAAPTQTSDRGCRDLSVCSGSLIESEAPTPTSDRVCQSSNPAAAEAPVLAGYTPARPAAMTAPTLALLQDVEATEACAALCSIRGSRCAGFAHSAQFKSCLLLTAVELTEPDAPVLDFLYYERVPTTTPPATTTTAPGVTDTATNMPELPNDGPGSLREGFYDPTPGSLALANLDAVAYLVHIRGADILYDVHTAPACGQLCVAWPNAGTELRKPCLAFEHSPSLGICVLLRRHLSGGAAASSDFSHHLRRSVDIGAHLAGTVPTARLPWVPSGGVSVQEDFVPLPEAVIQRLVISMRVRQVPRTKGYLMAKSTADGALRYYALYVSRAEPGQQLWFYYLATGRSKHKVVKVNLPATPALYGADGRTLMQSHPSMSALLEYL